jgi:hypothetical protein
VRDVIQEASHIQTVVDTETFVRIYLPVLLGAVRTKTDTVVTSNAAVDLAAALRDLLVLHQQAAKMRRQIGGLKHALSKQCGPEIRRLRAQVAELEGK